MPRPLRLAAGVLDEHVNALCREHGILRLHLRTVPRGGCAGFLTFNESPPTTMPYIWVPPVRGPVSYFVALHEVGHHRTCDDLQIAAEIDAWDWAFQHALLDPSPAVLRGVLNRVRTYVPPAEALQWVGDLATEAP